ncbi:cadg multi-domain protein [Stylonychia lemnae]|uniref:Cadg multi-domain protein n=1 Tax=Stylonychia lemnae TaxID=5949 RepID=A0A078B3A2_STYLE|nr:cadg multi-domain protein [Stylonychia lemnae]|eukprot:CDW87978.1 cadg multi-domain protein [Stylonychia lemnae]
MMAVFFSINSQAYAGNIQLYDDQQTLVSTFNQIFKPIAKIASNSIIGSALYDPDEDYVYVSNSGYYRQSGFQDTLVLKQSSVTGQVSWSRLYSSDSQAFLPFMAYNSKSKNLFVASTATYSHLIKISAEDGQTQIRVHLKTSSFSGFQHIELAIDESNNNVIVLAMSVGTAVVEIMTLTQNFETVSYAYQTHSQVTNTFGRFIYQVGDWYYYLVNVIKYGSASYSGNEVLLGKRSIKYDDYSRYECHSSTFSNYYALQTNFSISDSLLPSDVLYLSTMQLVTIDQGYIKSYQLQTYHRSQLLPNPDSLDSLGLQHSLVNATLCSSVTGYSAPSMIELDPIELIQGSSVSYTLDSSKFRQCQGLDVTYNTTLDETYNSTRSATNSFITISGNQITVDATSSTVYPSFRQLIITNVCTAGTTLCAPLVIGSFYFYKADVDNNNGNFLMCGQYNGLINSFYKDNPNNGAILLSDINGKIMWAFTNTHVFAGNDTCFLSCHFSETKYVYSGLAIANDIFALLKQDYASGKLIYQRQIPGKYQYNQRQTANLFYDNNDKAIYVTGYRHDQNVIGNIWQNYLAKIDVSSINPTQKWYSFIKTANQQATYTITSAAFSTQSYQPKNVIYNLDDTFRGINMDSSSVTKYQIFIYEDKIFQFFYALGFNYISNPFIDYNSYVTQTVYQADYKLTPVIKQYMEFYPFQSRISFKTADYIGCRNDGLEFNFLLENQIIVLPKNEHTYTFDWPIDCIGSEIIFSWSIDGYNTNFYKSFINFTNTSSISTMTVKPNNSHIGTYNINVKFYSQSYPAYQVTKQFILEIYPQTEYGSQIIESQCTGSLFPAIFSKNSDYQVFYGDVEENGVNYLICGKTRTTNALYSPYDQAFISVFTANFAPKFQLNLHVTAGDTSTRVCLFGYDKRIFSASNSRGTSGFDESIYLFQHSYTGKFINGKQFRLANKKNILRQYIVNKDSGDQYLQGSQQSSPLQIHYYPTTFIMKLDIDYNVAMFSSYRTSQNYQDQFPNTFAVDFVNAQIYSIFNGYFGAASNFLYTVLQVRESDGKMQWAKQMRDPGNSTLVIRTPDYTFSQSGLLINGGYVYSCITVKIPSGTTIGFEVYLTRHNQTDGSNLLKTELAYGVPSATQNITSNWNGCNIQYSDSSQLIYLMQAEVSSMNIMAFYANSTTSFDFKYTVIKFQMTNYVHQYYHIMPRDDQIYFFTSATYSSQPIGAFFKLTDQYNIDWTDTCQVYSRDSTGYQGYLMPNGIYGDQGSSWIDYTEISQFKPSPSSVQKYIINPQNFRIYAIANQTAYTRLLYGNCSFMSYPQSFQINNRTGSPLNITSGGFSVSLNRYSILLPKFIQCANLDLTYSIQITPSNGSTFITFNQTLMTMSVEPSSNTYIGNYSIRFQAIITSYPAYSNYSDFVIEIVKNVPPNPIMGFNSTVNMYAHQNRTWEIQLDSDLEGDEAIFNVTVLSSSLVDINSTISFLKIDYKDNQGIIFSVINPSQPPLQAAYICYYLNILVFDNYNKATPNSYLKLLNISQNNAPFLNSGISLIIPKIYITKAFTYTLWYNNFTDSENNLIIITCAKSTDAPNTDWITIEVNKTVKGNITFFGQTPRNNSYAGVYKFSCTVKDQYDGTPNIYNFSLTVLAKQQIQIVRSQSKVKLRLPQTITLRFDKFSSDPQQEPNYYSLFINDTLYNTSLQNSWIDWDNLTSKIYVKPISNENGGNHSMAVKFEDFISQPRFVNFTLEITQNWPLIAKKDLPNRVAIVNNWFFYNFSKEELFLNPEGEQFQMYFRQSDTGNNLPYFISRNFSNGTLGGYTFEPDVGSYNLQCVGIDDGNWETIIPFVLMVKRCNQACNLCYGPSSSQCFNCTEIIEENEIGDFQKIGYLLAGTECKVPRCINGQYFQWENKLLDGIHYGKCETCHKTCKRCFGPKQNQCLQCYEGFIINNQLNICIPCEEIPGMFTNEELECEDICGDGIVVNKQCDDGNLISGDGCSKLCQTEYGFTCLIANQACRESIPPLFQINTITPKNLVYVEFSEPVFIIDEGAISWKHYYGSENVKISFQNYSMIRDEAGNELTEGSFTMTNPYPFVYLSQSETDTAQNSGNSLKYTFLSVFSFNLALKLVMNSSMQFLWGLVHALQVFNFLLYMNIDFPDNVLLFSKYMQVASGNVDELQNYIPNVADYMVYEENISEPKDQEQLQESFKENDISPYFLISFGQKLTIWTFGLLIILPIVLTMNKLCKKIKMWESVLGQFFFNGPLRTFIEMYIELILQVIINTQFIKFENRDQIIATLVAFIFGTISILLPFLSMTVIYHNRKMIKKFQWKKSYGMLTDEVRTKSIIQLYYYPFFMFQRLMIAAIIVYVYEKPLLSCFLVILCNIAMIFYLILEKPFKEESQQTTTVLDELIILLCVIMFIILGQKQQNPDEKKNLGWMIVLLILFSVCKNFGVVIYFGFLRTSEKLKLMFSAEDHQNDSIHSGEEDDSDLDDGFDTDELEQEIKEETQKLKNTRTQSSIILTTTPQNSSFNEIYSPQKIFKQLAHKTSSKQYFQSFKILSTTQQNLNPTIPGQIQTKETLF